MKRANKNLQICLAGADTTDAAAATKALRNIGSEVQKVIGSFLPDLEESVRTKLQTSLNGLQTMLAGLPDPDAAAANEATKEAVKTWQGIASAANAVISNLQEGLKDATSKLQTTLAGIPGQITAAVEAKVTAGDFVPKAIHDGKGTDAISTATTAARAAALTETTRVNDRKLQLTTASMPIPDNSILAKEDADFNTAKTAAEKRVTELKPFGLEAGRVLTLAWSTEEAAYQAQFNDLKKVFEAAGAGKGAPANPFANRTPADPGATKSVIGLC